MPPGDPSGCPGAPCCWRAPPRRWAGAWPRCWCRPCARGPPRAPRGGRTRPISFSWRAALMMLGAAAGSLLPPLPAAATLLGAAAVLVPVAFPVGDWIVPVTVRAPGHDLLRALLVAGPCGLCLGALLTVRRRPGERG